MILAGRGQNPRSLSRYSPVETRHGQCCSLGVVEAGIILEHESITEQCFHDDLHSGHGLEWMAKNQGLIQLRELAAGYKEP